jgi:hypothetical protein
MDNIESVVDVVTSVKGWGFINRQMSGVPNKIGL